MTYLCKKKILARPRRPRNEMGIRKGSDTEKNQNDITWVLQGDDDNKREMIGPFISKPEKKASKNLGRRVE